VSRADRIVTVPFALTFTASFFAFLAIGMLLPVLPLYARGPLGVGDVGVGLAVGMSSPMALVAQPLAGVSAIAAGAGCSSSRDRS